MSYVQLYDVLPEVAMKETRTITAYSNNIYGLPPGDYGLVELYCKDCDCRRVKIAVVSSNSEKPVAFMYYGWESLKFYTKWFNMGKTVDFGKMNPLDQQAVRYMHGVNLSMDDEQSKDAFTLLKMVTEQAFNDKVYVEGLKRRYKLFRAKVNKKITFP